MINARTNLCATFLTFIFLSVLALADCSFGQTQILGGAKERQPGYGEMENFTIVGYSDLDGWDQVAEFRVSRDGKYAYTSNYQGASIVDVSDPARPKVVSQIKNDPSVQSQYIDVLGNILVVNQEAVRDEKIKTWESGIRLFDINDPAKPREVGFFKTDGPPRRGVHGFWLHEDPKQGKFAFVSTTKEDYYGNILIIVDINDPAKPKEVARWWFPGQWTGGGEKPGENWVDPDRGLREGLPKIWVMLHDITTYKDRAYLAYRDEGVVILDISDLRKPTKIGQIKWSPPEEGNTHSIGIVVPAHGGRPDLIIATDEIVRPEQCPFGYMHILDVRNEKNPVQISTFRLPLNRFCPPDRPGRRFGIHDVERMIKGNIVFSAWENSGFWAVDISDPYRPKSVGHFVPPVFRRVNADNSHADDVYVHENGLVFASSSDPGGGLWILRYTPGTKGTVSWTPDNKNVTVKYDRQPGN
jgi:hypothetical protein